MPESLSETMPSLYVCTTCRAGRPLGEGQVAPGQRLHDAVALLIGGASPVALQPVALQPVACLASCERGCTAAISAPGKWSYLLGGLTEENAADLLTYGAAYAASRTGTVLPSKRPASLARAILGRFPARNAQGNAA
jgi:predicted metal-binding protein